MKNKITKNNLIQINIDKNTNKNDKLPDCEKNILFVTKPPSVSYNQNNNN